MPAAVLAMVRHGAILRRLPIGVRGRVWKDSIQVDEENDNIVKEMIARYSFVS
jgi:hypothetical protein